MNKLLEQYTEYGKCSVNIGNYNDSAERIKVKDSEKEPSPLALPRFLLEKVQSYSLPSTNYPWPSLSVLHSCFLC